MSASQISGLLAFFGALGLLLTVIIGKAAASALLDASLLFVTLAAIIYCSNFVVNMWRDSHHA